MSLEETLAEIVTRAPEASPAKGATQMSVGTWRTDDVHELW